LFDQQSPLAGACTLSRDGDSIDATTDHHDVKVLTFERGARLCGYSHRFKSIAHYLTTGACLASRENPQCG
jgi:hypothetical protein